MTKSDQQTRSAMTRCRNCNERWSDHDYDPDGGERFCLPNRFEPESSQDSTRSAETQSVVIEKAAREIADGLTAERYRASTLQVNEQLAYTILARYFGQQQSDAVMVDEDRNGLGAFQEWRDAEWLPTFAGAVREELLVAEEIAWLAWRTAWKRRATPSSQSGATRETCDLCGLPRAKYADPISVQQCMCSAREIAGANARKKEEEGVVPSAQQLRGGSCTCPPEERCPIHQ